MKMLDNVIGTYVHNNYNDNSDVNNQNRNNSKLQILINNK